MGKGKSQTIGYKYSMSLLMGLGRTLSEIVQINVGEKVAWRGPECDRGNGVFEIRARDLFGGDEKEGGIEGPCRVLWGDPDQTLPGPFQSTVGTLPGVKETISPGAPMPALRGVTCLWYDGEICSINPYPKEWKVRVRRHIHGWYGGTAWYNAKAIIYMSGNEVVTYKRAEQLGILAVFLAKGGKKSNALQMTVPGNIKAMNAAHIIYECCTNPEWGRGQPASLLDENSFVYAANQLCAEGFGLCFNWSRQEDVDVFIQTVLDHVAGELYTDRSTGLLTLRLIRDDYDPLTIPTFSPGHGLLEILADDSGSQDMAYNEVVIKYHSPIDDTDGEQRAHNVGARLAQGSANSLSKDMPGIPNAELASRVALRELIVQSAGLKKYKVRLDRSGWRIAPGMPFRVVCPERGIASIILRAGEITDSSSQQGGDIQISALEDVFSMPATGMTVPQDPVWTPPVSDPVTPDDSLAFELSYYDLFKNQQEFALAQINDADAYFGFLSSQPTQTQLLYDLMRDDGAAYTNIGTFSFTANAVLSEAVGYLDTEITVEQAEHWPDDVIGDSLLVGDERMRIDGYDPATGIITVARGVADTLPQRHLAGVHIWLPDDDLSSDRVVYAPGEIVTAAAATRSNSGVLPEEEYDPHSVTIAGRVGRPYPPADLKVDGVSVFTAGGEHEAPVLTWVPRNRLTQQDHLVGHTEAGVMEEAGTSWRVDIYSIDGVTQLSTHDVPEGTYTFTYDADMQAADGSPAAVAFDVVAVRGEYESLAHYVRPVVISGGWDYSWGLNWA